MSGRADSPAIVDLVVDNLDVLVTDVDGDPLFGAALVVDQGRVVQVTSAGRAPEARRVVDGRGRTAIPGLVNAHAHAAFTLTRGWEPEARLDQWLPWVFAAGEKIGVDEAYAGARLAFAEMLMSGVTTCVDHHYATASRENTVSVARAAAELGLRVALATTAADVGAGATEMADAERDLEVITEIGARPGARLKPWVGLASPGRRESLPRVRELTRLARDAGVPITYHYAETDAWLQLATDLGFARPVDVLEATDLLGSDVLLAHGVWLTEPELDVLAATGTAVVHNPVSNMYLGDGAAPVLEMLDRGIRVALGTDGANCNNRLDLFASMKSMALLQKLRRHDGGVLTAPIALRAATSGGAEAIGDSDRGRLGVGAPADVVLVDTSGPAFQPGHDPIADLVYVAAAGDVTTVLIDGEIVVDDGQLTRADLGEICAQGAALGARVVSSTGLPGPMARRNDEGAH